MHRKNVVYLSHKTTQKTKTMKTYSIDDQEITTLSEIKLNNPDLTDYDIDELYNMSINEVCWIGFTHIKRIS